jgi:hypothetical protein
VKRAKVKKKLKRDLHSKRLALPPNKRHKSTKDYKRLKKVDHE